MENNSETFRLGGQVSDYLFGLMGTCFYRVEGWWTYEFCFQKHLKQFHQENNVNTAEFLLGTNRMLSDRSPFCTDIDIFA